MTSRRKKELGKNFFKIGYEKGFETNFETGFETDFETGRVVLVVETSKRKNGSKRSHGKNEMMK